MQNENVKYIFTQKYSPTLWYTINEIRGKLSKIVYENHAILCKQHNE